VAVVSVSLPEDLVDQADGAIAAHGYAGRSDLVRAALRAFLAGLGGPVEGRRSATLTLLYPDGFERRIADIRHDYTDVVRSMVHAHAGHNCLEMFVLDGPARRIRQFEHALRAAKETLLVNVTYTDAAGAHR
jgi:CopG family transcriptional regulator, nickel-responsive regulator